MCGIFGLALPGNNQFSDSAVRRIIERMFILSESRGKEAAGIAVRSTRSIDILKDAKSASELLKTKEYDVFYKNVLSNGNFKRADGVSLPLAVVGHSRLVTNGRQALHDNNQAVIKDGVVGVHNGIIVNDGALWEQFGELKREYEVDTEIILSLIRKFYKSSGSLVQAVRETFERIEGAASVALLFDDLKYLVLATNTGSLYVAYHKDSKYILFTSELYTLNNLLNSSRQLKDQGEFTIKRLSPGFGTLIALEDLHTEEFDLRGPRTASMQRSSGRVDINDHHTQEGANVGATDAGVQFPSTEIFETHHYSRIFNHLKRCSKCILPETFPFIEFDSDGVCNYCRQYRTKELKGKEALVDIIGRYKRKDGRPDCIVAFSGGRDSTYALHYIKKELGLDPIAYTYDWGMVTDLARRNQSRICGKLGVEHILVSADIQKKRRNIGTNVRAWLKKPELGMVPLFMAGDKQFFYYARQLCRRNNIGLAFINANNLERTDFKTGFAGVREGGKFWYDVSPVQKLQVAMYYAGQCLRNPAYINPSLADTLKAFVVSYLMAHQHISLYDYIPWDEDKIMGTLTREYDWETAEDTQTTWRIGDGTAAFYNYIYFTVAGFTEHDTFRSNQIREGAISRSKAFEAIRKENLPRFNAIEWYCRTVNVDFKGAVGTINNIPKLYNQCL